MSNHDRPPALIGWRLLALLYDFFPLLAMWFVAAAVFTFAHGDSVRGWLGMLLFCVLFSITGLYAVLSWKRGGQTIGMRPWRLRVTDPAGSVPGARALWLRFGVGCLSLGCAGLGFWWAWFDRDGLTWHDRASGTRMLRAAKTTQVTRSPAVQDDGADKSPTP